MNLIIDRDTRERLARFLKYKLRPRTIPLSDWEALQSGDWANVPFGILGALCDEFGADQVLGAMRYPETLGVRHV